MGTVPNIFSNIAAGDSANVSRGIQNLGMPVMNNQGTPSVSGTPIQGPTFGGTIPGQPSEPILKAGNTITPPKGFAPVSAPSPYQAEVSASGGSGVLLPTDSTAGSSGAYPTVPTAGTSTTATSSGPFANLTSQQQQELQKQLIDIYGKGEGNLLNSLIGSIGGGDDAYLQAYIQAMAGPNAENLATLSSSLGNSGVGPNSSASAIATADYLSNVTSQEGLQEQQLKMNDLQQLMSLTQGLQGGSASEVSSGGFLNDLASVTSSLSNLLPFSSGGNKGNAGNVSTSGAAASTNPFAGSTAAAPLGEGAIPLGETDTSALPDLSGELGDSSDLADLIGAGVFI